MGRVAADRAPRLGWRPIWREGAEVALCAVVLALFVRTFLFQAFHVPSDSMAPTLRAGDQVLVNKFVFRGGWPLPAREPRPYDLALFRLASDPDELLVKRCVAVEGERVELVDKQLRIDGHAIREPWAVHGDDRTYPRSRFVPRELRARDNFGPRTVPPGHLFFLGDNRDYSRDSRSFGAVPRSAILGRPVLVFWSRAGDDHPLRGPTLARSRLGRLRAVLFGAGDTGRGIRLAR
ncbi:MAG TPA: signal peptidase I [Thermoanaerobaculia bacterium]|nr:signal peptidase I [Thermoanaerobaculia bacterium]